MFSSARASLIEITLLNGEWKDWQLTLQQISKKSEILQDQTSKTEKDRILSGNANLRLFKWGVKGEGRMQNYDEKSSRHKTMQYQGVRTTNIPRILIWSRAFIQGEENSDIISSFIEGYAGTWNYKFVIDTKKHEDNFVTFELKIRIPLHEKTLSIGSKTVSVKDLKNKTGVWNLSFSSGNLHFLVKRVHKSSKIESLYIDGDKIKRAGIPFQKKATLFIPPNHEATFYAYGKIRFYFKNVCRYFVENKFSYPKIWSYPDGSQDVVFFAGKDPEHLKKLIGHFNDLKLNKKCPILDFGVLFMKCNSSSQKERIIRVNKYKKLPPFPYPQECRLVGLFHGEQGYTVDAVLTPK